MLDLSRFGRRDCLRSSASSFLVIGLINIVVPVLVNAEEERESVLIYRTPEERRDSGIKHQLTDWITVAGLAEFEYLSERLALSESISHSYQDENSATLQIASELIPLSWLSGEFVYEYDAEIGDHLVEEAFVAIEIADFTLEVGQMELPFGEYLSYFTEGPLLEFGETREQAVVFSYDISELTELSAFSYVGRTRQNNSNHPNLDWGLALESEEFEWGTFGVSFISDLADSTEGFLSDSDYRHEESIPALSWYMTARISQLDLTFEYVGALRKFDQLEREINRPRAWNLEAAHALTPDLLAAIRFEWSEEAEDAPHYRSGLSVAWRFTERALVSVDLLRSWYRQGLATDNSDREVDNGNAVIAKLSLGL